MRNYIIENGNFYRVSPSGAKRQGRLARFIQENFAKELENAIKSDYNKATELGNDLTFNVIEFLRLDKNNNDVVDFVGGVVFNQIELGTNK